MEAAAARHARCCLTPPAVVFSSAFFVFSRTKVVKQLAPGVSFLFTSSALLLLAAGAQDKASAQDFCDAGAFCTFLL